MRSYFGGWLVGQQLGANIYEPVIQDRLGSVGNYYPYGEERNSPQLPNDQVKFATYTRDSATGNDYADQRYYTSTLGRFMSADPYRASTDSKQPQSFDRYGFVWGDPINGADPTGLCTLEGVQYPDGLPPCPDTTSTTVNGDPEPVPLNVTLNAASGNPTNSGGFTKPIGSRARQDLFVIRMAIVSASRCPGSLRFPVRIGAARAATVLSSTGLT